jgi:integrase
MSNTHSTTPAPAAKAAKPAKPYPDFPLTAHPAGVWCKKIRGKVHYFGKWDDPQGALQKYLDERDALQAGRTPRPDPAGVTVKDVANALLNHKRQLVEAGELSNRTFEDYHEACALAVGAFGKSRLVCDLGPEDFALLRARMARTWGVLRLAKGVQCVRCLFKHALDARLIAAPVCFGPGFKAPSAKTLRLHRAKQGPKLFTAEEVRRLIAGAGVQLKAMILLGINCGFGNSDCGNLPLSAIDWGAGVIDYPRPKTGVPRRGMLWPETARALREAVAERPTPKDPADAGRVFLTRCGLSWVKAVAQNPVAKEFKKLLRRLQINGRKGLGFYTLRHVFRTVADEAKDQPAADFIMGHESPHMSTVYRERISDLRLQAVSDHVRTWLFRSAVE